MKKSIPKSGLIEEKPKKDLSRETYLSLIEASEYMNVGGKYAIIGFIKKRLLDAFKPGKRVVVLRAQCDTLIANSKIMRPVI